MPTTRRNFLRATAATGATAFCTTTTRALESPPSDKPVAKQDLDRILDAPVLTHDFLKTPVTVASIDLLKTGNTFLLRTRSTDGVEAITVPNSDRMANCHPLFLRQVIPVFVKQDARKLESLLWDVYRHKDNYKYQGLSLWICVAAVEMALLELMAQTAQRPVADFFGGAIRRDIPIYTASGVRGNTPEAEVDHLRKLVAESGAKALKF